MFDLVIIIQNSSTSLRFYSYEGKGRWISSVASKYIGDLWSMATWFGNWVLVKRTMDSWHGYDSN